MSQEEEGENSFSRRSFMQLALAVGAVGAVGGFVGYNYVYPELRAPQNGEAPSEPDGGEDEPVSEDRLTRFADNLVSGGPPPDGIPPIEDPKYVGVDEAPSSVLRDEDFVFGTEIGETPKAYPQLVLVWHEIVNDTANGERVSITYCPLTGTVIGFEGDLPSGGETTFGTSGQLLNSNLVMYDRETNSKWPQMLMSAVEGPLTGKSLETFPVVWSRWKDWKEEHPDTLVLSTETGFARTYGSDPYGSYRSSNNYYDSGGPFFPVMNESGRFPDKKVVFGIRVGGSSVATPTETIEEERVMNLEVGGKPVVVLYDRDLGSARAFSRRLGGQVLEFQADGDGYVDTNSGSSWSPLGAGVEGIYAGESLSHVPSLDAMWFAWYAFDPETRVVG